MAPPSGSLLIPPGQTMVQLSSCRTRSRALRAHCIPGWPHVTVRGKQVPDIGCIPREGGTGATGDTKYFQSWETEGSLLFLLHSLCSRNPVCRWVNGAWLVGERVRAHEETAAPSSWPESPLGASSSGPQWTLPLS